MTRPVVEAFFLCGKWGVSREEVVKTIVSNLMPLKALCFTLWPMVILPLFDLATDLDIARV